MKKTPIAAMVIATMALALILPAAASAQPDCSIVCAQIWWPFYCKRNDIWCSGVLVCRDGTCGFNSASARCSYPGTPENNWSVTLKCTEGPLPELCSGDDESRLETGQDRPQQWLLAEFSGEQTKVVASSSPAFTEEVLPWLPAPADASTQRQLLLAGGSLESEVEGTWHGKDTVLDDEAWLVAELVYDQRLRLIETRVLHEEGAALELLKVVVGNFEVSAAEARESGLVVLVTATANRVGIDLVTSYARR